MLRNNQTLAKTMQHIEERNKLLEKKVKRKRKFEELVKNCERLQCKECGKLYTPSLFAGHNSLCRKQHALRQSMVESVI